MIPVLARSARVLAIAALVLLAGGTAWLLLDSWTEARAGAQTLLGAAAAVGLTMSAAALLLVWRERWAWAAVAALLAAVAPTGFAYLGNAATLALAIVAASLAVMTRAIARVARAG